MELFGKFHGIDVLCLALFIRIIYIAAHRGLLIETIKLTGVFFATFISPSWSYRARFRPPTKLAIYLYDLVFLDGVEHTCIFT